MSVLRVIPNLWLSMKLYPLSYTICKQRSIRFCSVESKSASKRICNYVCPHFVCNNVEGYYRLLLQLTVTAHEAVNTTCCIDKLALTGIEWVRGA